VDEITQNLIDAVRAYAAVMAPGMRAVSIKIKLVGGGSARLPLAGGGKIESPFTDLGGDECGTEAEGRA
jgi:hypothetical protein